MVIRTVQSMLSLKVSCHVDINSNAKSVITAVCKNRRLRVKDHESRSFYNHILLELCPSYYLTITHLTYNPFLYIKSIILYNLFNIIFISFKLLLNKL
jgi:hypothetical protein